MTAGPSFCMPDSRVCAWNNLRRGNAASDIIFPESRQYVTDNEAEECTDRIPAQRIGEAENEQYG